MKRRIGLLISICVLIFSTTGFSFASEADPYQAIVDKYNKQYNVNLSFENIVGISLEEFDASVREFAKGERETLDYIAQREKDACKPGIVPYAGTKTTTVTRTKTPMSVSNEKEVSKSAYKVTYTYYTHENKNASPSKWVSTKSGAKATIKINASLAAVYGFSVKNTKAKLLDSARTIGVTATGTLTVRYFSTNHSFDVNNISVYTEYGF